MEDGCVPVAPRVLERRTWLIDFRDVLRKALARLQSQRS
jgi:hypothetical protein